MKIIILASEGDFTRAIYNNLAEKYEIKRVIIEQPVPAKTFFMRRIRKLGLAKVLGQILFIALIQKPLKVISRKRIAEINSYYNLDYRKIPDSKIRNVNSINDDSVREELKRINPDAVIVFGTRIIKEKILTACEAPFINMHMGITPLYRGVHGGYWALASNDAEHCGVTVHLVDKGIDTGSVIGQKNISVERNDNFVTYPYIQFGKGIELYNEALQMINRHSLKTQFIDLPSKLWSHPTILEYIKNRIKWAVK